MPIVVGIVLFILLWMRIDSNKNANFVKKEKDAFWKRENSSNNTRKADIASLDYIKIPIELLPFTDTDDEELNSLQKFIKSLSKQPILNLTGLSNTDLKLKYGVANITFLSDCDNNYTILVQSIYKWGSYLYSHNQIPEAITVLEYGIQCKTDLSKNYILLAKIYKDTGVPQKIDELIAIADTLESLMKTSIVSGLKEIKLSTYLA